MFATANAIAREFTFPVIVLSRNWGGDVGAAVGAFVLLNADGWIVTAAHVLQTGLKAHEDRLKIDELRAKIAAVEREQGRKAGYVKSKVRQMEGTAGRDWITNHSYWWGRDGLALRDITAVIEADLAIGRLDPFPPEMLGQLPVLKEPTMNFQPGASLCRLGFPFGQVSARFDSSTTTFSLEGEMPVFFPLDGIFTRGLVAGKSGDGRYDIEFIETSSPGLLGQSGGPIFDVHGRVWGIQSRTQHIPLGFNPPVPGGAGRAVVPQFINLGVGAHVGTLMQVLDALGVTYQRSPD